MIPPPPPPGRIKATTCWFIINQSKTGLIQQYANALKRLRIIRSTQDGGEYSSSVCNPSGETTFLGKHDENEVHLRSFGTLLKYLTIKQYHWRSQLVVPLACSS